MVITQYSTLKNCLLHEGVRGIILNLLQEGVIQYQQT